MRQVTITIPFKFFLFQSTHPRGVRPKYSQNSLTSSISIHAPTWGATTARKDSSKTLIFQSTHPRGVRRKSEDVVKVNVIFQSTHPRGVRRLNRTCRRHRNRHFNPRTHVGCDAFDSFASHGIGQFQSTHPRGVRPLAASVSLRPVVHFNPRTHVGCDWAMTGCTAGLKISIHAPTWGATGLSPPPRARFL